MTPITRSVLCKFNCITVIFTIWSRSTEQEPSIYLTDFPYEIKTRQDKLTTLELRMPNCEAN